MGNTSSLQLIKQHFPSHQYTWTQSSHISNVSSLSTATIVYDMQKNLIGQKYSVSTFQSLQFQLETYLFRKQNLSTLVTVYDLIFHQNHPSLVPDCMTNQHNTKFSIVIQRIPYRLTDVGVIKFEEMIYILSQCFKALQILWLEYGKTFYIDEDNICFNTEGVCKLWINDCLNKNAPNVQASFQPETIIKHLFQVLETRVCERIPQSYQRFKNTFQMDKFTQALSFIQKTQKKFNINLRCIQSLKTINEIKQVNQINQGNQQTDSQKVIQQRYQNSNTDESKRIDKFSLKNQRSTILSRQSIHQQTTSSKQQTTQVSLAQLERTNKDYQDFDQQKYLRSTFKSLKRKNSNTNMNVTEYSQKCKRKISNRKNIVNMNIQPYHHQLNNFKLNLHFN